MDAKSIKERMAAQEGISVEDLKEVACSKYGNIDMAINVYAAKNDPELLQLIQQDLSNFRLCNVWFGDPWWKMLDELLDKVSNGDCEAKSTYLMMPLIARKFLEKNRCYVQEQIRAAESMEKATTTNYIILHKEKTAALVQDDEIRLNEYNARISFNSKKAKICKTLTTIVRDVHACRYSITYAMACYLVFLFITLADMKRGISITNLTTIDRGLCLCLPLLMFLFDVSCYVFDKILKNYSEKYGLSMPKLFFDSETRFLYHKIIQDNEIPKYMLETKDWKKIEMVTCSPQKAKYLIDFINKKIYLQHFLMASGDPINQDNKIYKEMDNYFNK